MQAMTEIEEEMVGITFRVCKVSVKQTLTYNNTPAIFLLGLPILDQDRRRWLFFDQ